MWMLLGPCLMLVPPSLALLSAGLRRKEDGPALGPQAVVAGDGFLMAVTSW